MLWTLTPHARACSSKQDEREWRIASLPPPYHELLSSEDYNITNSPLTTVVANVHAGKWTPCDILLAYSKWALRAHALTNCLTEVMILSAEETADNARGSKGPLAGVPISLKDTFGVKGYDSCIGYSAWTKRPFEKDAPLVRLLKDAGAVPFVKTNIPITLLSAESANDVFGRTLNPHNLSYTSGGSSGGEGALLALGGSCIGIGTDVGGSVRLPAHFSGIYALRCSVGRFPRSGGASSMPGQEGVASVASPMARSLGDLKAFWKAIISMEPWKYDYSVINLPWRSVKLSEKKSLRWGVMRSDGFVEPSPACNRALTYAIDALRAEGHEVVEFTPPDPFRGFQTGLRCLLADGAKTIGSPFRWGETADPGFLQMYSFLSRSSFVRRIYSFYLRYIRRDPQLADLVLNFAPVSDMADYLARVAQREVYRSEWHEAWNKAGLDFLLCVPYALPALPHNGSKYAGIAFGYTFLFNIVDYTAGVLPVTRVDAELDAITPSFASQIKRSSAVMRNMYKMYDPKAMEGLPIGLQIVGQRLEEEKVLAGMEVVQQALERSEYDRPYSPIGFSLKSPH